MVPPSDDGAEIESPATRVMRAASDATVRSRVRAACVVTSAASLLESAASEGGLLVPVSQELLPRNS